jgi:hypothetical protein
MILKGRRFNVIMIQAKSQDKQAEFQTFDVRKHFELGRDHWACMSQGDNFEGTT